jgi:hypothetical protein
MTSNSVHTAVIGYQYDDSDYVDNSGSIYIYYIRSGSVTFAERIEAQDPNEDSQFGYSVAVHAGHIIVGAPGYTSEVGIDAGAAYMFTTDSYWKWYEATKLWANDSAPYMRFGISVAIYENYALVGADQAQGVEAGTGALYLFSEQLMQDSRKKATTTWHMPSNPENEYLFLLTVLPLAVLFIPIIVLTCVWYCNQSNWGRIEEATAKAISKAQRDYRKSRSGAGGAGVSIELSHHSSHGLISGAEDVSIHSDLEVCYHQRQSEGSQSYLIYECYFYLFSHPCETSQRCPPPASSPKRGAPSMQRGAKLSPYSTLLVVIFLIVPWYVYMVQLC